MIKHQSKLVLYFILIVTAGCSGKADVPETDYPVINNPEWGMFQDAEEPPVHFELIDEFIFDESNEFIVGTMWYLNTDSKGNLYFYDYQLSRLVSLNPEGKLRWSTGEKGRGPGDFEGVNSVFLYKDKIYVSNISGSRLDIFDLNGILHSSNNMPKNASGKILGISNEELIIQTTYWQNIGVEITIANFTDSVQVLHRYSIKQLEYDELDLRGSVSMGITFHNDQIISGNFGEYTLKHFDLEGNILKEVRRDFNRMSKPGITANGVSTLGGLNPPVFFPDGHYATRLIWADNISDTDQYVRSGSQKEIIFKGSLDFFSPEDELLYSFLFDGFSYELGSLSHVDENGYAYFTSTYPHATIKKYKIHFPKYE